MNIRQAWPQFMGLVDQSIVSAGNFVGIWVMARKFAVPDYGLYVLVIGLILSLNSIQSAFIVFPFTIRYAAADLTGWQAGVVRCVLLSVATISIQIPIVLLGCLYLGHLMLGFVAVFTLCLWQMQEVIRRAMFQRQFFGRAVLGDSVRYAIPALLVVGLPARMLSTPAVLIFIAVSSIAASLLCVDTFATRRALSVSWMDIKAEFEECWRLGRHIILFNAFGSAFAQGSVWILGNMQGLSAASQYQAVSNVMGITNPPVVGIAATLQPAVARAHALAGPRAAMRQSLPYLAAVGALVVPLLLVFTVAPRWTLLRFYGGTSPYRFLIAPLRIAALAQVLSLAAQLAGSVLACVRRADILLRIQIVASTTCLIVMIPAVRWGALPGYLLASALFAGLVLAATFRILRQTYRANLTVYESGKEAVVNA